MKNSLRIPAAAALVVLASACGSDRAAVLSLGQSSAESRGANPGAAMSDSKVGAWAPYVSYVAGGELSDPKWMEGIGRRRAWRYTAPTKPGKDLSRIASTLGVAGVVKEDPEVNGYWSNEVMPGGQMFSSWGDAHGRWWSYTANMLTPNGAGSSGSSGSASSEPCPPDLKDCEVMPPIETVPPAENLPSKDVAKKAATVLLEKIGVDVSSAALSVDVQADEWSVRVSATALVDGETTWVRSWYLRYGSDARLTDASGSLVTLEEADTYPVVTPVEAVERLSKGFGSAGTHATGAVTRDVASGNIASGDSSAGAPDAGKIELVSARISLIDWTMSDGTQMLLPAWALADADGNEVRVVAVGDDYIEWPTSATDAPTPVPQPGPTPGTDVPAAAVRPADAEKLVGLTEDEATRVATGAGWTIRVVSRDGEDFLVTTDWQGNRVNITVVDGTVTAVTVG
ncbi:MAG: hypothetical protein RLZZ305_1286 [Actinomycetota bacterium]|jgi:hypothetical protein